MTVRLAADIGGTRARFAVGGAGGDLRRVEFASAECASLEDALARALQALGVAPDGAAAALAVAGPVRDGAAAFTNLDWHTSERALRERFGFARVRLLNDAEAAARAAAVALPADAAVVHDAHPEPDARHALVTVGTGLGVAYWHGARVDATEAGHARRGDVEWEQLLSGAGWRAAPHAFCATLGEFCRELVLVGPAHGVLLCGGVVAGIGARFDASAFVDAFAGGPMRGLIERVPVWRTADDGLALRGAIAAL